MFIGTYEHTIDEKSRLTLPARFREALGDGVVLARGIDGNVAVYPRETWKVTVEARMSVLDPLSREARELRRFFSRGRTRWTSTGPVACSSRRRSSGTRGSSARVVVAGELRPPGALEPKTRGEKHLTAVEGSVEHAAERLAAHGS
jgi:MraZ protein